MIAMAGAPPAVSLGATDLILLAMLLPLLAGSGFFSASETALFGMSENERLALRRGHPIAGRAVESLLADPRMLLLTLLLGNVTVNTLYFVVSSVLLVQVEGSVVLEVGFAVGTLLMLILCGEIVPKLAGESRRSMVATLVATPLLALHRIILPVRAAMSRLVVEPLARLTAPRTAPPELSEEELGALLEISARQGLLESHEQELLLDVVRLQRLRVRDVHVPRVRMEVLPIDADERRIRATVQRARLSRLPVFRGDVDHLIGLLPVKRYLLAEGPRRPLETYLEPIAFVPEIASVEALLVRFRETGGTLAVSVDEFGGTAGVVALEDVVEAIVGEIVAPEEETLPPPRRLDALTWEVPGEMRILDWQDIFGAELASRGAVTLGGLMLERLGRAVHPGDRVRLANVELSAGRVERAVVRTVLVRLLSASDEGSAAP